MNSMTKRFSIALASVALAGGTLLTAGGAASAATTSVPAGHAVVASAVSGAHEDTHGNRLVVRNAAGRHADQVQAASWHYVDAARWHEDQVDEAASRHHIDAARWYEDQVVWALNHR
ncbi:hypothetical protein ACFV0T_28090 [Streptomyces sp. NPDC059582]|uniref:hypothetical protein n=1 Tax=Streptomyces sp. NPDC059582 TaxID=3346875 RepID=UPI003699DEC4